MTKRHIYRDGNRFSTQRSRNGAHVGYFEFSRGDWGWCWSRWARQDRPAQHWVYNESVRLRERVTR